MDQWSGSAIARRPLGATVVDRRAIVAARIVRRLVVPTLLLGRTVISAVLVGRAIVACGVIRRILTPTTPLVRRLAQGQRGTVPVISPIAMRGTDPIASPLEGTTPAVPTGAPGRLQGRRLAADSYGHHQRVGCHECPKGTARNSIATVQTGSVTSPYGTIPYRPSRPANTHGTVPLSAGELNDALPNGHASSVP